MSVSTSGAIGEATGYNDELGSGTGTWALILGRGGGIPLIFGIGGSDGRPGGAFGGGGGGGSPSFETGGGFGIGRLGDVEGAPYCVNLDNVESTLFMIGGSISFTTFLTWFIIP